MAACVPVCVCCIYCCAESVGDLSDEEPVDNVSHMTTDTVYSNLASLLTALQSARPPGHTVDSCMVNNISVSYSFVSISLCVCVHVHILITGRIVHRAKWKTVWYCVYLKVNFLFFFCPWNNLLQSR